MLVTWADLQHGSDVRPAVLLDHYYHHKEVVGPVGPTHLVGSSCFQEKKGNNVRTIQQQTNCLTLN
jgi:hypothetical protein